MASSPFGELDPPDLDLDEAFAGDDADGPEPPDDPRRRRRVRALVAACVVGALVSVALAVVGTRIVVHELREPTAHERLVDAIRDRARHHYDACVARGADAAVCASRAASGCRADPRWTLSDLQKLQAVCVFGPEP